MRGVILLLAATAIHGTVNAATVVRFGAKLCDAGAQMSNGQCIENVRGKCPAGYYQTVIDANTYAGITFHNECMNAYNKTDLPDIFYPIYTGVLVKFGPALCGASQQYSNGVCIDKEQGRCPDGAYKTVVGSNTFSSPSAQMGECMNSYNQYELPKFLTPIYNGILVSFGATLCGSGKYLSDGACVPYERGECPENFYTITSETETLTTPENAKCANGYGSYWLNSNCAAGASTHGLCAVLCEKDLEYTGLGTCATLCPHGKTELHAKNGMSWPLYAEKLTTPAMNIKMPGGVCYINFLPGAARGTMNVKSTTGTYHISD